MKKLSLGLALILILIPFTLYLPVSAAQSHDGGSCGISATWTFEFENGTLTISGNGEMEGRPAINYVDQIQTIVIEDGITNVSHSAFSGCVNLTRVELPGSVAVIEYGAFTDCSSLEQIRIPGSVTEIRGGAFGGCASLAQITFCGTEAQWNAVTKGTAWDSGTGNYTVSYHTVHNWSNETITKQPTCVNGTKTYTCSECGEMKMEYVSPISDHTYSTWTSYSITKHQSTCICGNVQYEDHVFDSPEDESCNLCNFLKSDEPKNPNLNHESPFDHTYNSWELYNEQFHKQVCDCGYSQAEKHVYSSDDDADCDLCGFCRESTDNNKKASKSGCKSALASGAELILLLSLGASAFIRKKMY